jgi:acyl-CoA thioester hydrolase
MDQPFQITVPFRDVDMHGHVHNAVHLAYFEAAISHFLRRAGLSDRFSPDAAEAFHVRRAEVLFHAPTRYEDTVTLTCAPAQLGRSSLRFDGRMTGADPGDLRATAQILWVCVARATGTPIAIPDPLRSALSPYLPAGQAE